MKLKCGDSISRRSFLISASAMHLRDATELSERASERGLVGVRDPALLPYSLPLARSPADSGRVHACFRHCGGLHHHTQVPPPPPPSFLRPSFVARSTTGKEGKGCDEPTDADGRTDRGRIAARMRSAMPEGLRLFRFFPEGKQGRRRRRAADRGGRGAGGQQSTLSPGRRRVSQWAGAGAIER